MASTLACLNATSRQLAGRLTGVATHVGARQARYYASESADYRPAVFSNPPPPPPSIPITARGLPSAASPSKASSAVSSAASTPKAAHASEESPLLHTAEQTSVEPKEGQGPAYAPDFPASFGKNQHLDLDKSQLVHPSVAAELEEIVSHFRAPIRYAFAYGSGVFRQAGYTQQDKPMLDFVFAVSHPSHWHSINLNQNKDHYSMIARIFGSNVISILQTKVGAGVWFNVECMVRGRIIKYGVVSVDTLTSDLLDWESLYLAGRMHKPILILRDEPRIRLANQVNLSSAIRASLLLLPETFSEEDLYRELAALSYRGDFRMQVGENPNKVKNIVTAQAEQFSQLYQPILRSFHKHVSFMGPEGSGSVRQDINPRAKADLARRLPLRLREMLRGHYERNDNILQALGKAVQGNEEGKRGKLSEETALWTGIVKKGDFKQNLDKSIQMIVGRPAFSQSAKGVFSVGPVRGIRYVWPKLKKKWSPGK